MTALIVVLVIFVVLIAAASYYFLMPTVIDTGHGKFVLRNSEYGIVDNKRIGRFPRVNSLTDLLTQCAKVPRCKGVSVNNEDVTDNSVNIYDLSEPDVYYDKTVAPGKFSYYERI